MDTATGIEIKWLDGADLNQLAPQIQELGWIPLNPQMARAVVAFSGDTIVGFCPFNCVPHIDLWVDKAYRGSGLAQELTEAMVQFLFAVNAPGAYVVADNPHTEALCRKYGMKKIDAPVYFRQG